MVGFGPRQVLVSDRRQRDTLAGVLDAGPRHRRIEMVARVMNTVLRTVPLFHCDLGLSGLALEPCALLLPQPALPTSNRRFSISFKSPVQLPIGDAAVVLELLPSGRVHVMLQHVRAERLLQQLR